MDKRLLQEAQSALSIQEVVLHSTNVQVRADFSPYQQLDATNLEMQHRFGTSQRIQFSLEEGKEEHQLVEYRYQTGLRLLEKKPTQDTDPVLVTIETCFAAIYLLSDPAVSNEALDEFAHYNVGYNIWPYWREYAASTLSRMRLPPITIPLYRIPPE